MYGNGICDWQCNSDGCGYDGGDCSIEQRGANCLESQRAFGQPINDAPFEDELRRYPMVAQMHVKGLDLSVDDNLWGGKMGFEFELEYTLQYSDPRLSSSACSGAITAYPSILSASQEEIHALTTANTIKDRRKTYYVPSVCVPRPCIPASEHLLRAFRRSALCSDTMQHRAEMTLCVCTTPFACVCAPQTLHPRVQDGDGQKRPRGD
eukprot:4885749-Prymnesium_polylepis.1